MRVITVACVLAVAATAFAQERSFDSPFEHVSFERLAQDRQAKPFEPVSGQAGKDVVWVPSPPEMVNKMMEMAKVGPNDVVIDLGSGDEFSGSLGQTQSLGNDQEVSSGAA